jgi:hypothetical protein
MTDKPSDIRPARGYSWPPFEVGNFVPVRHGRRSPRITDSLSSAVADALVKTEPWLADKRHALALSVLAGNEAIRLLLLYRIECLVLEGNDDELKSRLIEDALSAGRAVLKTASELGMTPTGRARLAAISTSVEIGQHTLVEQLATAAKNRTVLTTTATTTQPAELEDGEDGD